MQTRGSRRQAPVPSSPPPPESTDTSAEADGLGEDSKPNADITNDAADSFTTDFIPILSDSPQDNQAMDLNGSGADKKRKRPESHNGDDKRSQASIDDPELTATQEKSPENLAPNPKKRAKVDTHLQETKSQAFRTPNGALSSDRSQLPKPLWQHVFSFLPPQVLGRLLKVNKAFHNLLKGPRVDADPLPDNTLKSLEPDVIWRLSRRRFYPHMPKPLDSLSELESWKLVYGRDCQFCNKEPANHFTDGATDPLNAGPGSTGVRIVWPFAIRSCGQCLMPRTERDLSLLMSSAIPSELLAALPFIFLTSEDNVILPNTLQSLTLPANFQMPTKRFYKPHVEAIQRQFEEVKSLGGAAVEEWMKGLEAVGQRRQNDATRWDRWDVKTNVAHLRALPALDTIRGLTGVHSDGNTPTKSEATSSNHSPRFSDSKTNGFVSSTHPGPSVLPRRIGSIPIPPAAAAQASTYPHPQHGSFHQPRVERSLAEVNQAKLARKQEIEKRCAEFDPPIPSNVLSQMDSFHAAIQISTPLSDSAWEVLKPRLIAQRELGEERERARIAAEKAAEARLEEKKQEEAMAKQAKERDDRDWDEKQNPIRELLGEFANEFIKNEWDDGKAVTKDTCTKFAADVLLHVRKRFYDQISAEDNAARVADEPIKQDPVTGPPTRRLILENMKWVFDTKIKPLTEPFRKELFLCHDCDSNTKYYGFEGVIQHFAAKHTSVLSVGSIVVHWRAEWPDHSPFHSDPSSLKPAHHPPGQPQSSQQHGFNGYNHSPGSGNYAAPSIAQTYPPGALYHEPYPGGPRPPSRYQDRPPDYPPNPSSVYESTYPAHGPPKYHGQQNQYPPGAGYPDYPSHGYGPSYHHSYPGPTDECGRPIPIGDGRYRESYPPYEPPPPRNESHRPEAIKVEIVPPSDPHTFKQHLEVMAAFARDIWTTIKSVNDIPTGVKFYVLIHHVVTRVKNRYGYEPGLEMFTEGVENQHLMRPIKHAPGAVGCRTCLGDARDPRYAQYGPSSFERVYQLPSLLKHFKTAHIDRLEQPIYGYPFHIPDWKQDMVELPEEAVVSALIHVPGMDDQKLRLLAEAFPPSFPNPLPRIGVSSGVGPSIVPLTDEYNAPPDLSIGNPVSYNPSPGVSADSRYNQDDPETQRYSSYTASSTAYDLGQTATSGHNYRDNARSNNVSRGLADEGRSTHHLHPMPSSVRDVRDPNLGTDVDMEREPSYDPRHSDLVFAPKGAQVDTSSRPKVGRKAHETQVMEEGSEDGEVGPISGSPNGTNLLDPRNTVQSAADQFLQNFEKDTSQPSHGSSARNNRRGNNSSRNSWLKNQDPADRSSRVSTEAYDEYTRTARGNRAGESSYGHTPVYREHSWNENDNPAAPAPAPIREYSVDGRPLRNLRAPIEGDRYAEHPEQVPARSYLGQYQEYVEDPEKLRIEHGRYRYEPSGHSQYSRRPRSPRNKSTARHREAYPNWRHAREPETGRYGSNAQARTSPTPASYVPEDLKRSLQIPASSNERAYVEDPRHTSSYRTEYVRVAPYTEDARGGFVVGPPVERSSSNTYSHYEDTRGRPIYVEQHPTYQADVRLYEREDPRYGSRRVRYD